MADQLSPKTAAEWLRFFRKRPLCIICARPSEALVIAKELQCEKNKISNGQIAEVDRNHVFYYGSFDTLDFYITSSLRQGIQSFTIHASILFHILKPRYAIHAGVCAGYADPDGKIKLRHVIFGEAAVNCDEGKWVNLAERGLVFKPDLDVIRLESCNMQSFADDPTGWHDKYHYGDFISVTAVREDAKRKIDEIRSTTMRNAIGLDMEASAFLKLCKYMGIQSMGVVKGVSDFGDSHKGEDPAAYPEALRNTARALDDWIRHSIPNIDWKPNEDHEPGVHNADAYYKNFVHVVCDSLAWGLAPRLTPGNTVIQAKEVKGLMVVVPHNFDVTFFAEAGQVANIIKEHEISTAILGEHIQHRNLYYKSGYLIDFPRIINNLLSNSDSSHQVRLFRQKLLEQSYFKGELASAQIVSWEEFKAWTRKVDEEEERIHWEANEQLNSMLEKMHMDPKTMERQQAGLMSIFGLGRKDIISLPPACTPPAGHGPGT